MVEPGAIEIRYAIVEPSWGRGYATEAVTALIALAREDSRIERLVAHTPLERPNSGRVLEKAGFQFVGETEDSHEGQAITVRRWELVLTDQAGGETPGFSLSEGARFKPNFRVVSGDLEAIPHTSQEVVQMIRWSPVMEAGNLHSAMDRLYDELLGPSSGVDRAPVQSVPTYVLPLDIREVESGYEVQAPVPGFSPEDVEITFSEGVLKIQAQRSAGSTQQQGAYLRKEVAYGNYLRGIQLPGDIDENDITATFDNGILTVSVPKAPRPQPKKIQISGKAPAKKPDANGKG